MSPEASAAWVAGSIALAGTILNLIIAMVLQRKRQVHELNQEALKANLTTLVHEKHHILEGELDGLRSELSKSRDLYAASIPLQQQVREHLATTRTLLARVYTSFAGLSRLAPTLGEHDILIETTNTLDLYAEYRQHLSSDRVVSYPEDLQSLLKEIQSVLARIFLDLQIDDGSRSDPLVSAKMKVSLDRLESLRDSSTNAIERVIRVRLDPLQ
jgi:hypothetical protein